MKYYEKPSERTVRRAAKFPKQSMAISLYEAAVNQTPPKTMEEMLKLPLYFAGQRVDGYVEIGDTVYAYSKEIPPQPQMRSMFVYLMDVNGCVFPMVGTHATKKHIKKVLGICVMEIKLLPNLNFRYPQQIKDENEVPQIVKFYDDSEDK